MEKAQSVLERLFLLPCAGNILELDGHWRGEIVQVMVTENVVLGMCERVS